MNLFDDDEDMYTQHYRTAILRLSCEYVYKLNNNVLALEFSPTLITRI